MPIFVKCKSCEKEFRFTLIGVDSEKLFYTLAKGSTFANNSMPCPNCKISHSYSGTDHYWKD